MIKYYIKLGLYLLLGLSCNTLVYADSGGIKAERNFEPTTTGNLNLMASHSFYYEQYETNRIMGYVPALMFNFDEASVFWGYVFFDIRGGWLASKKSGQKKQGMGSVNLGLGLTYGRPFNVYGEFAFDLLESVANDALKPRSDTTDDVVDVDAYGAMGVGYRINPMFQISLFAKLNAISGFYVRNHSAVYYGIRLTAFRK